MEIASVLQVAALELGVATEIADQLAKILEPVTDALSDPEDFGLYYYSEDRCVATCNALEGGETANQACVLLWHGP